MPKFQALGGKVKWHIAYIVESAKVLVRYKELKAVTLTVTTSIISHHHVTGREKEADVSIKCFS